MIYVIVQKDMEAQIVLFGVVLVNLGQLHATVEVPVQVKIFVNVQVVFLVQNVNNGVVMAHLRQVPTRVVVLERVLHQITVLAKHRTLV
jgi:hypothetical protein